MSGWISLHRKIQNHWIWGEKPFDKRSAWIDLILSANYRDNTFLHGNELINIPRGSFVSSENKLSIKWGWSRTKVRNFLNLLEKDNMIIKISDNKKTCLSIVNYNDYQIPETSKEQEENIKKTSIKHQKNTNNKENKDNKENKENKKKRTCNFLEDENIDDDFKEIANLYQEVLGQPNGLTQEWIKSNISKYGFEWLKSAMIESEKRGKRNKKYIEAILENWKNNGGINLGGENHGSHRNNDEEARNEANRLKELAIKEGLLKEDGSVQDIGEIDF